MSELGASAADRAANSNVDSGASTVPVPSPWRARAPWLFLVAYVALTLPFLSLGLADNGDFQRAMAHFSSGPVGVAERAGEEGGAATDAWWEERYFNYYHPEWKARFAWERPRSTTLLLWAPGFVLGRLLGDRDTFSFPVLTLLPRLALAALLVAFVRMLARDRTLGDAAFWVCGALLLLCATTADYQVYLNSMYLEVGTILFLLAYLLCLLARDPAHRQPRVSTLGLLALVGLCCSRPAQTWWALPGVLLLRPYAQRGAQRGAKRSGRRAARVAAMAGASVALFVVAAWFTVWRQDVPYNTHNRIAFGLLLESRDPNAHLAALDLADLADVVGHSAHDPELGMVSTFGRLRVRHAAVVALREPAVVWRAYLTASRAMQDISLDYLAKHPRPAADARRGGVRLVSADRRTDQPGSGERRLDADVPAHQRLWTIAKFHAFPRGAALLVAVPLMLAFLHWAARRAPAASGRYAFVGVVCLLSCLVEIGVAIAGDGRWELIKHLLVANVLFDAGLILTLVVAFQRPDPPLRAAREIAN